jgi:hypothetical protein
MYNMRWQKTGAFYRDSICFLWPVGWELTFVTEQEPRSAAVKVFAAHRTLQLRWALASNDETKNRRQTYERASPRDVTADMAIFLEASTRLFEMLPSQENASVDTFMINKTKRNY